MTTCKKCGTFRASGFCKVCNKAAVARYREKNKEKVNLAVATWALKNKDAIREKDKQWRSRNIERIAANGRAWAEKNKDKLKIVNAKYSKDHRELLRVRAQNRKARISESGVLSKDIVLKLMDMQKGCCAICRNKLNGDYQLDHIIPIALGGLNIDTNIQLAHGKCNRQKHAIDPIKFMQSRGFLL